MEVINTTANGQIFVCPCNRKFHLEFGNLLFNLSYEELTCFVNYVNSIDYKFFLAENKNAQNNRKLLLNIGSKNKYLALNENEFLELKKLLLINKTKSYKIKTSERLIKKINLN